MFQFQMPLGDAVIEALLGYALVFAGLILLMLVVSLIGVVFSRKEKPAQATAVPIEAPPVPQLPAAPGTAGQLKLHNVEPKTAAMLMAIVANRMGKPINELRFISIREVSK